MNIFISGTDTNVGKTLIASWLALHTGFSYFKPIQTGTIEGTDSLEVQKLSNANIYPETYRYPEPVSPHLAAKSQKNTIDIHKIILPKKENLIIEGAGGVLVPINDTYLMIDLIKKLETPVILVSRTTLGTINHTLLSLAALRSHNIPILGVIMNGLQNTENKDAIAFYGQIPILAEFPLLESVNTALLKNISLSESLKKIFNCGES